MWLQFQTATYCYLMPNAPPPPPHSIVHIPCPELGESFQLQACTMGHPVTQSHPVAPQSMQLHRSQLVAKRLPLLRVQTLLRHVSQTG